jgi:hypothetical protein
MRLLPCFSKIELPQAKKGIPGRIGGIRGADRAVFATLFYFIQWGHKEWSTEHALSRTLSPIKE